MNHISQNTKSLTTCTIAFIIAFTVQLSAVATAAADPADQPAPASAPNQTADGTEELGTTILDLNKRLGTFRDWLDHMETSSKLPPDFQQRVARLAELRQQADQSLSARAAYEDAFSSLLTEFDSSLSSYVGGEDEAYRRIDDMKTSLQAGKSQMDIAATVAAASYDEHTREANNLVASIAASGRRAKAIISAGGTVSAEVQAAALKADSMAQTAQFLADVAKAKADQARAASQELDAQLKELKSLRANFEQDFQSAKNARLKASAIADYRRQIADSQQLLAQLEILKEAHRRTRPVDTAAFKTLSDLGPGEVKSAVTDSGSTPENRGLEVMLRYADQIDAKPVVTTTTQPTENIP